MTVALIAAIAGWTVSVAGLVRLIAHLHRAHARREDLLTNQLLHAAGKTWTPPPSDVGTESVQRADEPPEWTASPEQLPVY